MSVQMQEATKQLQQLFPDRKVGELTAVLEKQQLDISRAVEELLSLQLHPQPEQHHTYTPNKVGMKVLCTLLNDTDSSPTLNTCLTPLTLCVCAWVRWPKQPVLHPK